MVLSYSPNGWETWADVRRTGYPKFIPVKDNLNHDVVATNEGMRRIPFPGSQYWNNNANVKDAVNMLEPKVDAASSKIWWDK